MRDEEVLQAKIIVCKEQVSEDRKFKELEEVQDGEMTEEEEMLIWGRTWKDRE